MKLIDIEQALKELTSGGVVAMPTETVYGLAGHIHSESGLKRIFSTKERPFFDPLIVHVANIDDAKKLSSDWTEIHQILAQSCWPGPLTLITKKATWINPLITSGLDSVGIRCPNHPIALELLKKIDGGLAAPSANKFGKTSPTQAQHVFQEFGEEVSILDGGASEVGIESSVVGIQKKDNQWEVLIYRPGFYTPKILEQILQQNNIKADVRYAQSPVAPGQLKHHYMPNIPLVIVNSDFNFGHDLNLISEALNMKFKSPILWNLGKDPQLASRMLYQDLREFSSKGFDLIVIKRESHHNQEDWVGIWNRLNKAKSLILGLEETEL